MNYRDQVLQLIKQNPSISQNELAEKIGIPRSTIAGVISALIKEGVIRGRAYILNELRSIACIGGSNIDYKAVAVHSIEMHTSNPVTLHESPGGVCRNIAENLANLSCHVSLYSFVGNDREGSWIMEQTRLNGVDVSQVQTLDGHKSGSYTAVLQQDGEMVIAIANMGIYDAITPTMIETKWKMLSTASIVILDTNLPEDCIQFVIDKCRNFDIPLLVDPVSTQKTKRLPERLDGVFLLFPNREEAEILSGIAISSPADCEIAAARIRERGAAHVIITLGEQGIFYSSSEQNEFIPPYAATVLDVTGAGDSFVAGVAYGLEQGKTVYDACRTGLAASSITLQSLESVSSELKPNRINQIIEENE